MMNDEVSSNAILKRATKHYTVVINPKDNSWLGSAAEFRSLTVSHRTTTAGHRTGGRCAAQNVSNNNVDIVTMLDDLNLPVAAGRLSEILNGPELGNYSPQQLLREVIEPQHIETMNTRYQTNLRLSKLLNKNALAENLVTSDKRRYNEDVVRQLLSFRFADERLNVGVYGVTEAGKSYFMSAFCREACRKNYRCMYVDYCDLLDWFLCFDIKLIRARARIWYKTYCVTKRNPHETPKFYWRFETNLLFNDI